MPTQGYLGGNTANYVQRHNPFVWYSDVANSVTEQDNMYPFTQFAVDLANNSFQNFSYIVPNLLDNAHGTGTQTSASLMASADSWLQTNIGPLLTAPNGPFQPGGDGILIVVFDEAEQNGLSGDVATDSSCSPTVTTGCGGQRCDGDDRPQCASGFDDEQHLPKPGLAPYDDSSAGHDRLHEQHQRGIGYRAVAGNAGGVVVRVQFGDDEHARHDYSGSLDRMRVSQIVCEGSRCK